MEGLITQKVTPLVKCFVLFLFIFTAKVLTSRPHESNDVKNEIQHVKHSHYVRTFTKYHHRRTIRWNNQDNTNYWPPTEDQLKPIEKRNTWSEIANKKEKTDHYSINDNWPVVRHKRSIVESNEIIENPSLNRFNTDVRENIAGFEKAIINPGKIDQSDKNRLLNENKNYKVKAAMIVTDPPTTMGPTISCLFQINSISMSQNLYSDDQNAQYTVETDHFETGSVTQTVVQPGSDPVSVEKCKDTRATCYALWHQNKDGNITVLGQGCWRASDSSTEGPCNKCTRITTRPDTKFCCCTDTFCNANFTLLNNKEEAVPIQYNMTDCYKMSAKSSSDPYAFIYMYLFPAFIIAAVLLVASLRYDLFCKKKQVVEDESEQDIEKGEVMGTGPDALATGLACVDNITLLEHIGQGKFGSVWRGSLGSKLVAVKLYSNASTWQKEAAIYALPHLSHSNILRYYGSDTRQNLTSGYGREHLIVLELCSGSLRARLERAPLSWREFAELAHGLAAALAHLHTPSGNKPCIVHRDVTSNNVLLSSTGACRLADLGLAQALLPRHRCDTPTRITEAGTLRYLAPEALEGALDLTGASAALCAVDVYALGLVLWEMMWRTSGAHVGPVPTYMAPYQDQTRASPNVQMMQNLVSRNKVRPPLPKGPVPEARALKIATDTCDECWDHDAEARLTAVCVEERMNELKQIVSMQPPRFHDNMLHLSHTHPPGDSMSPPQPETDKNSNCTSAQRCDVTTPLLYPRPHIGRNTCIERNTHSSHPNTLTLIHKSLKDITAPAPSSEPRVSNEENCLSVARTSTRIQPQENSLNEIRSYQRPLDYVPNDVTAHDTNRGPKETNLLHDVKVEKPKWNIKKFFEKFNRKVETEVKLVPENSQRTRTSIIDNNKSVSPYERPSNLVLNQERNFNFEAPCLSPPNRTLSQNMMAENVLGFKELPPRENETRHLNQMFAVIVPKAKPTDLKTKSKGSSESINKQSVRTSMSSQSMFKSSSESEDSTVKKRLSSDNKIINSASSSRASINLELQYMDNTENFNDQVSPFDLNSDCSSSEDEHLMLLSEDGGSKITMHSIPKNDVLKESQTKAITFNKVQNKYTNFENEFSDANDKENLNYDNPVYLAALKGEIQTDLKIYQEGSSKPALKQLAIKRQHSLEQVSELFTSAGDVNLLNPAGRVKTPGDLPVAVRRARRDRALQKGRTSDSTRLSLYDDRMMFGNSL